VTIGGYSSFVVNPCFPASSALILFPDDRQQRSLLLKPRFLASSALIFFIELMTNFDVVKNAIPKFFPS
jgi:hypothetical protein